MRKTFVVANYYGLKKSWRRAGIFELGEILIRKMKQQGLCFSQITKRSSLNALQGMKQTRSEQTAGPFVPTTSAFQNPNRFNIQKNPVLQHYSAAVV